MRNSLFCLPFLFFQASFSQVDPIVDKGQQLIFENKLDAAIAYYNEYVLKPKNSEQEVHMYLGLAEAFKLKLNYEKASEFYAKAYEAIKVNENKQLEFLYHVKMGEFFRKRTLFTNALSELDQAATILKNHTISETYLAKYYNRKAALFTEYYFMPDSTLAYANKSLSLSQKIDDKDNIFYSTLEIAGVYDRKKEYKKSIVYLEELIDYAQKNNLIQHRADAYINYADVLIKDQQLAKALIESLKALEFAKEHKLLYNEIISTIKIYETYKALNNTEKAYEYLEYRLKLTDEYYKLEHNKFLFELEEKYKLVEKENQIIISSLEIENKNKELATNRTRLYVSIGLFVCAILIALLISYLLRKTKKSNKQLQFLSQENEFLLSEANHRINNNLQLVVILISDQLKKTSGQERFQLKNILTKVEAISTLHKHLYKNEDKKKVDIHKYLNDVKVSFFVVFKENDIQTNFEIASAEIPSDNAMYFGLLLTELYINSIKHAFNSQDHKEIDVKLTLNENGLLHFNYSDNGADGTNKTIQPKLIDKICRQLKIDYHIDTQNGFKFYFQKKIIHD
ncbi:MAG: sensor histidine kinase [Aquaticitalea sp.]